MMDIFKLKKSLIRISTADRFLVATAVMIFAVAAVLVSMGPRDVSAKPAYAQSTGYPCSKCHTGAPSASTVNAFGKAWKAKQ